MNENESRQWVEGEMGWEGESQPNDALTILICENLVELRMALAQLINEASIDSLSTITTTLWTLNSVGYPLIEGESPIQSFVSGFAWGMLIQRWIDEKGIDLEAM